METTHKEFRLWLTSMPTPYFPVSILRTSVKMTMEPPKGLKANLRSVYLKLDDEKLGVTSKPGVYRKLLFALVFFHATVQERRMFGPLGWNVPYEFNETDLDISREQLVMFLDSYSDVPFRVLQFLTSYINYGGRVTDYIDLRTIDVIVRAFLHPRVFENDFAFDPKRIYFSIEVPAEAPHAGYIQYIESLPFNAGPGIFGMHENASITCAVNETFEVFDTLVALESSNSASTAGAGADTGVVSAADIDGATRSDPVTCEIEHMLPLLQARGLFELDTIAMCYPVVYEESMHSVLAQECIRYNKLLCVMLQTLPELCKAMKGLIVMSTELEAVADSLAVQAIPQLWAARAYPSMKRLSGWFEDLVLRLDFFHEWIRDGIPDVFWISGFFFPQAFFTGSMQNFARRRTFPIDTISFDFQVLDYFSPEAAATRPTGAGGDIGSSYSEVTRADSGFGEERKDGVCVRGLFLEGARWDADAHSLADSIPKQLYTLLPLIHFIPAQDRRPKNSGVYRCPVYKILSRRGVLSTTGHSTNFIL